MTKYFTVKEVAASYGVKIHTVGVWIKNGSLKAIDISRRADKLPYWRIREADLMAFEESRLSRPPAPAKRASQGRRKAVTGPYPTR